MHIGLILTCLIWVSIALVGTASAQSPSHQVPCAEGRNVLRDASVERSSGIFNGGALIDGIGGLEGDAWDSQTVALFEVPSAEVSWRLSAPVSEGVLVIQGDNNDSYNFEGSVDGVEWFPLWSASPVAGPGLRTRVGRTDRAAFSFLKLTAAGGDSVYSVGEVALLCGRQPDLPQVFTPTSSDPFFPRTEFREGAGALRWVMPFFLVFLGVSLVAIASWIRSSGRLRFDSVLNFLQATYASYDCRSLAVFRILFGALMLFDLYQRWMLAHIFYSPTGLVTPQEVHNGQQVWFPFTMLRFIESEFGMQCFFGFAVVVSIAYLLGIATKIMQLVALFCVVSLHNANPYIGHSGHMVMRLALIWTAFLPLGGCFSVDSYLRHRRSNQSGEGQSNIVTRGVSLAFTAVLLQLTVVYFFNTISKFASPWNEGSLLYLVLFDEGLATAGGIWARDNLPLALHTVLAWGTLLVEGSAPFLLLSPWKTASCRVVAILLLTLLHLGILLFMPLSIFSFAMITLLTLLLPGNLSERILRLVFRVKPLNSDAAGVKILAPYPSIPVRVRTSASFFVVLYLLVAHGSQLIRENEPLSTYLPHKINPILQFSLNVLRTYQGWCMFATCTNTSNSPISTSLIVVGESATGEKVDILRSAVLQRYVPAPLTYRELPTHVSHELLHTYFRSLTNGNTVLVSGLKRWIWQHHTPKGGLTIKPPYTVYERWQPLSVSLLNRPDRFIQGRALRWENEILDLERNPGNRD